MWGISKRAALLAAACAALAVSAACLAPQARAEAAPGEFAWAAPWQFGTTESSYVADVVKGPAGAVYVAGVTAYSQTSADAFVARLDAATGAQVWRRPRAGVYLAGAAADARHDLIIAGSKGGDIVVVKYRPDGHVLWARSWGSPTSTESALGVAVAPDGSVRVAGLRFSSATGKDGVVLAFRPGGGLLWSRLIATRGDDVATAVTADTAGNTYVTGSRNGTAAGSIWTTAKYGPLGKRLWRRDVTFLSSNPFGEGEWLQVRGDALYVAAQRGATTSRFAAMKLSLTGHVRWLKGSYLLPGPAYLRDAAVDAKGQLYLAGGVQLSTTPGGVAGEILVCRPNGQIAWHDEFEDPLGAFDTGFDGVAVDASQRPYLAGYMAKDAANSDLAAVVVRYDAAGAVEKLWRWDADAAGPSGFGPLLLAGAPFTGGQATTAAGSRAVVERLKP